MCSSRQSNITRRNNPGLSFASAEKKRGDEENFFRCCYYYYVVVDHLVRTFFLYNNEVCAPLMIRHSLASNYFEFFGTFFDAGTFNWARIFY